MSQFFIDTSSIGPVPPFVATTYVTDVNSPAIPAANILNVIGGTSTANDIEGIRTDGSSGSNTLTVQLTNRLQGTATTVGATSANAFSFNLGATPASYMFDVNITAFDASGNQASGYWFMSTARTTGVAATVVGTNEQFAEDPGLAATDVDMSAAGNVVNLVVTGVAGVTLNWSVVGYYVRAT